MSWHVFRSVGTELAVGLWDLTERAGW